jgi:PadR family transcriptional regulator PadR
MKTAWQTCYLTLPSSRLSLAPMTLAHDPQLLKGVLSLLLLHLLAEQESYGYEIVQRLQSEGLTDVLEGTVYPALARLEREGRVAARLISSSSGPARKYYRPTAEGYAALAGGTAIWARQTEIVSTILTRPLAAAPAQRA